MQWLIGLCAPFFPFPGMREVAVRRGACVDGRFGGAHRYENGMNGILADEMGLGKTIQSIGVLAHLWSKEVHTTAHANDARIRHVAAAAYSAPKLLAA